MTATFIPEAEGQITHTDTDEIEISVRSWLVIQTEENGLIVHNAKECNALIEMLLLAKQKKGW